MLVSAEMEQQNQITKGILEVIGVSYILYVCVYLH